ncbi:unnamed protein product [Darwinula stevensoni]|uniref:Target of rapamycin complex subunit lst8 n=1 Tax=Darwinula stevensoni TaxID=69355 RepID=A0A7R8ZXF8_9CRUS|nr:unnamed protein product [Darwinula stevensoni]CAG0878531.1 unnamed protein product [Darwinula stevensoni]
MVVQVTVSRCRIAAEFLISQRTHFQSISHSSLVVLARNFSCERMPSSTPQSLYRGSMKYSRCVRMPLTSQFSNRNSFMLGVTGLVSSRDFLRLASSDASGSIETSVESVGYIPPPPSVPVEIPSSDGVLQSLNALGEPTLQSLGLGSNVPSGIAQQAFEFLHVQFHEPWWMAIAFGTFLIRVFLFPLVIMAQRNAAIMNNNMPQLQLLQLKMSEARQMGNTLEDCLREKMLDQGTVGAEGSLANPQMQMARYLLRAMPIIIFPFTINFPGAILVYWVSTNFISLAQVLFLRIPGIRDYCRIPRLKRYDPDSMPVKKKGFTEGVSDAWTNMKIAKELEDRRQVDEIQFKKAGTGAIKKTYSYDPTKQDKRSYYENSSVGAAAEWDYVFSVYVMTMVGKEAEEQVILATGGYDHTIRLWQAHTGSCLKTMQHPNSVSFCEDAVDIKADLGLLQVNALEISPDNQLLAAAGYQHIRMYDVASGNDTPVINYEGVSKNITAVGFQENGRWMFTGGEDHTARIWDLRSRSFECQRIFQLTAPVNCAFLHPNQAALIVGDQSGVIHIWDLKTNHYEQLVPEPDASVQSVCVSPRGDLMAAVNNKGIAYIWAYKVEGQLEPKKKLIAHARYALQCHFSPDGMYLVTTSADQTAKLWSSEDFSLFQTLADPAQRWVWDIGFSADSQYIFTASSDATARLWQVETGEIKREYTGHQKAVTAIAFRDVLK